MTPQWLLDQELADVLHQEARKRARRRNHEMHRHDPPLVASDQVTHKRDRPAVPPLREGEWNVPPA